MLKTMKLRGTTKSKITKDKNKENVPHLEINDVSIVIIKNDYQLKSLVYICS